VLFSKTLADIEPVEKYDRTAVARYIAISLMSFSATLKDFSPITQRKEIVTFEKA